MNLFDRFKRLLFNEPKPEEDPELADFTPGRRRFLLLSGAALVGSQIPGWVEAVPAKGLSQRYIEQYKLDEESGLYLNRIDLLIGAAVIQPNLACRIVG